MDHFNTDLETIFESPDFAFLALRRAIIRRILHVLNMPLLDRWFKPNNIVIIEKLKNQKLNSYDIRASNINDISTFPLKCTTDKINFYL